MSLFTFDFIAFAGLLVLAYFVLPKRCQWVVLLIASFVFYAYGGVQGVIFILVTIVTQWLLALLLQRENDAMAKEAAEATGGAAEKREIRKRYAKKKRLFVWLSVLINLGILIFHKYANVFVEFWNDTFGAGLGGFDLIVPLGLSYYTFKSIGYVIDVYRGRVPAERNPLKLALFVSYFPALVQGPIDRYEHLAHQLVEPHRFDFIRFQYGVQRMFWGYIKKMVIADRIGIFVAEATGNYVEGGYVGFTVILGVALYAFELYADFSGGIDVVCGLSEIFGISLTENFRQPFFVASIAEYWQRWHISLGAWMRTYVFYPLSLSSAFTKLGRKVRKVFGDRAKRLAKVIAPALASFITFVLIGMWHGVGWKYVWWGLIMAIFVSCATLFEGLYAKGRALIHAEKWPVGVRIIQVVRTFVIIAMLRFITIAEDMDDLTAMLTAAFSTWNPEVFVDGSLLELGLSYPNFIVMIVGIAVLLFVDLLQERGIDWRVAIHNLNIVPRWAIYYLAILSLIIFGIYGSGYEAANFAYAVY